MDADLFLSTARAGARAVTSALAGAAGLPDVGIGADGAITHGADALAESVMVGHLAELAVPIVSEEGGLIHSALGRSGPHSALGRSGPHSALGRSGPPGDVPGAGPWICLDPLDGSRNHRAGAPPYATAVALVLDGVPVAGVVHEHGSQVTWSAVRGGGARRTGPDGVGTTPVAAAGELVAVPSVRPGEAAPPLPGWCARVRMTGCTTVDLCRVADGSLAAFVDLRRGVVHPHDLAAPLVILREAGAAVTDPDDRRPDEPAEGGTTPGETGPGLVIVADPRHTRRLVAAWAPSAVAEILAAAHATT
ncbi:MAG: inositol monophosphatase family protein [Actinomycetota bacterium]|nr:inositol monophosphatase family protein [Actinomycetota bacterium]